MRSISRVADVSINTVSKLLVEAGEACLSLHDQTVRDVKANRVQCDEIWSFCYAKDKNVQTAKCAPEEAGDVWTWTALDADSKLIVSYFVGNRQRSAQSPSWTICATGSATASSSPLTVTKPIWRPLRTRSARTSTMPCSYKIYAHDRAEPSAATAPASAAAPGNERSRDARTSSTFRPATLSARTSPCACPCGASPG